MAIIYSKKIEQNSGVRSGTVMAEHLRQAAQGLGQQIYPPLVNTFERNYFCDPNDKWLRRGHTIRKSTFITGDENRIQYSVKIARCGKHVVLK